MGLVIDTLPTLAAGDCSRAGLFRVSAGAVLSGEWIREDNTAAPVLTAKIRRVPAGVSISYTSGGVEQSQTVAVRFRVANYGERWRVPVFVCPETGRECRNLYFVGGRFVSRFAFRGLYRSQTVTKSRRAADRERVAERRLFALLDETNRRRIYKGRPTRYARQLESAERIAEETGKAANVARLQAQIWALRRTR